MSSDIAERRSFRLPAEFYYLMVAPETPAAAVAFIALHGYGSNPEEMLNLTRAAAGDRYPVLSLQAPNQFLLSKPEDRRFGYNWGVPAHAAANVALHHEMVSFAAGEIGTRFAIPPSRCVLIAFSQAVAFNYRFLATHPARIGGAIAVCGGVPNDWESGPFATAIQNPVLHISTDADEFYPVAQAETFARRLSTRICDVEWNMLSGKHRFPSSAGPLIRDWLARKFRATPSTAANGAA